EPSAGRPKVARNAWFTCVVVSAILAPSIEKFEKSNFQTFFGNFSQFLPLKSPIFHNQMKKIFSSVFFYPYYP
ncbi:hypothetical protein, partial [Campylobacter magnus]|uniref:hypothetical protein n=1 Tax=Campylobacter magnus TaxID=3026462 RepID=UPI0026DEB2D6